MPSANASLYIKIFSKVYTKAARSTDNSSPFCLLLDVMFLKAKPVKDSKSEIQFTRKNEKNKIHAIVQKKNH